MEKLLALGFVVVAGQIDRGNKNYGFCTPNGPVLTPEGEALVKELTAEAAPKPRKRAATVVEPVPEQPFDPEFE